VNRISHDVASNAAGIAGGESIPATRSPALSDEDTPATRSPAILRPLRILVAEDNPIFQSVLRSMLTKWGYDALVVHNGLEAWQVVQGPDAPRLAILDWMMPGMDGVEVCRHVRAEVREPYIYLLLLTARTAAQDLVEGMDAGADDYLTKPFNAHELRVRLRAGRRIIELQEQLLLTREALRLQATQDGLTGLLNRMAILEALKNELARADREPKPIATLMVDLDHFKQVNDTYGHLAGDAVLREAACRMKGAVRSYDAVGRYGGEEFLIVLPGCEGSDAQAHAERIRQAIAGAPFPIFHGQALRVTCSIGVSCRRSPAPSETDTLIRDADLALYQAKNAGRDQVVW
jgi:two-component system cell cycle response regulator